MRKSQARTGVTPTRVVIATVATAAAVGAGLSSPALAATPNNVSLTANVTQINSLGGTAVTLTGGATTLSGAGGDAPYRVWLTSNATCSSTYPSASTVYVLAGTGSLSGEVLSVNTPPVAPGTWKFCAYDSATTPVLAGTSSASVLATPWGAPSSTVGPSGGGNNITLNAAGGFTGSTFAVEFNTTACPATYTAVSGTSIIAATTATKSTNNALLTTVPTTVLNNTGYYICAYSGTTTGASGSPLVARSNNTYGTFTSTLPTATVTPANGASATATTITVSTTAGTIPSTGTLGVIFTRNTCPTSNSSPSGDQIAATPVRITTGKVAVPVTTAVVSGAGMATTGWNVCLYNGQNAMIASPAVYTVAPQLSLTGVNNAASFNSSAASGHTASVSPTGGPAQGGTPITISDLSGIPTVEGAMLQVSLGGSPLNNVKAVDGTTITGTTTPHAPGSVNLTVTTAAGTKSTLYTLADATTYAGVFNFSYAINVSPNTAPPAAVAGTGTNNPWIDITGAGFSGLDFSTSEIPSASAATKAHVLLTDNAWYSQGSAAAVLTGATGIANPFTGAAPPITQCTGVLVIGDNEIVCQLDLANTITGNTTPATAAITTTAVAVPTGVYNITVVNSGGSPVLKSASFNYSIVSSSSTFTVASF
jgi:IPT/TIG domain-containing protein